jgi:hypothetical protein
MPTQQEGIATATTLDRYAPQLLRVERRPALRASHCCDPRRTGHQRDGCKCHTLALRFMADVPIQNVLCDPDRITPVTPGERHVERVFGD